MLYCIVRRNNNIYCRPAQHRHKKCREDTEKKMSKTGGEAIFVKAIISLLLFSLVSTFGFAPQQISIAPTSRGRITTLIMSTSEPMLRSTSCLTSSAAQVAIDAACQVASDNGWNVTIAVSDAGGVPLLVKRCDDAFPASYEIAVGKARTAALFRKPTGILEDSANVSGGSSRAALLSAPFVLMRGGFRSSSTGRAWARWG